MNHIFFSYRSPVTDSATMPTDPLPRSPLMSAHYLSATSASSPAHKSTPSSTLASPKVTTMTVLTERPRATSSFNNSPASSVFETATGFHVERRGSKSASDFTFVDGIFDTKNRHLAKCFKPWGRVFAVMDGDVAVLYREKMKEYFNHFGLDVSHHGLVAGDRKDAMDQLLALREAMGHFGLLKKEPLLVVGGTRVIETSGFACATISHRSPYVCIPTTLAGLLNDSTTVSIAIAHKAPHSHLLSASHPPSHTFLDQTFLLSQPMDGLVKGFARLIKTSACSNRDVFELLDRHCEALIETRFGRMECASETLRGLADVIIRESVQLVLKRDSVVSSSQGDLTSAHEFPLCLPAGIGPSVETAFYATVALGRGILPTSEHTRLMDLFTRAGLVIDDAQGLNKGVLEHLAPGTQDEAGLVVQVPGPRLGESTVLWNVKLEELAKSMAAHRTLCKPLPRLKSQDGRPSSSMGVRLARPVEEPAQLRKLQKKARKVQLVDPLNEALVNSYNKYDGKVGEGAGRARIGVFRSISTIEGTGLRGRQRFRKGVAEETQEAFSAARTAMMPRSTNTLAKLSAQKQRTPANGIGLCQTSGFGNGNVRGHRTTQETSQKHARSLSMRRTRTESF